MQRARNQLVKRQATGSFAVPTAPGLSGGKTASSVDVGTSLLLGGSASVTPSVSDVIITEPANTSTFTLTPDTTSTASPSNNTSPSLSTRSVIAIIVAVFLVIIGAMVLIYICFKKRTDSRARHPLSRGPPLVRGTGSLREHGKDKQRNDGHGHEESKNSPSRGVLNPSGRSKSPDSAKFGLFEKDPSIRTTTDEKANISEEHHFDPSTMANFTKYQAGPADDLSTLPHPRPLAAREEGSPAVSWDGRTVISDPFLSLHASVSDSMSPTAVTARQTPRATDSAQHRWESAEVVMMDEHTTDPISVYSDASQNPFGDDSAPRRSNSGSDRDTDPRSASNPFFNASQHNPFAERSTRSRASSVSTTKRSRSYSVSSGATVRAGESENALFSLLAALDPTPPLPDDPNNRSSMHTTSTVYPPAESEVNPGAPQAF